MKDKCYNFLMENFGHVDINGALYIAELCEYDLTKDRFGKAYEVLADKYDTTTSAIERSVRYYIATIVEDNTLAIVCDILNYKLNTSKNTLKVREFVPLLQRKIRSITE